MPKHEAMAQISRPFQIVVVVFLVFACVWLFALQGRSSTPTSSSSAPVVSATTPAASAPSTAASSASSATAKAKPKRASTHVHHGPVPGLEGLTRDISRAHHAVGVSEGRTQRIENKSAQVAGEATPKSSTSSHTPTHTSAATAPVTKASTHASSKTSGKTSSKTSSKTSTSAAHKRASTLAATLSGQRTVDAELAKGEIVLLLFWNPKGTEDVAVQQAVRQVQTADRSSRQRVAVQEAMASHVASFGSVTRGVQVYATPTLFVINKAGHAIVLTGLQDAFSIQQTIDEAE
jgi:cytoskeletal protein RodZ